MPPTPRAAAGRTRPAARSGGAFQTSADGDAVWKPPGKPPAGFPPMADDEPAPRRRDSSPSSETKPAPAAKPSWSSSITSNDAAGGLLALFAWPLVLNYLRHGPAGPKAWLKAKFLNDPTSF